ncbi:hypothetical protein ACTHSK_03365 [Neisseria sp. P0012.S006]|jgi:hypothetical protein|uniref:hypothetical protein n=1 Tax=unclassified Neisseria TaxID=2623750 RepID=UPI003F822D24
MTTVKLRAFEIVNTNINSSSSDVGDKLRIYLDNSKDANERRMLLNSEDPQKEEDLISNFTSNSENNITFCTMLRVALGNNVQHIDMNLFNEKLFTIDQLNKVTLNSEAIYKNHYYFSMNNNFLVTNLQGNITITRLQTYLNWLLNGLYEINPLVSKELLPSLSEIKDVTIRDSNIYPQSTSNEEKTSKSFFDLGKVALEFIKSALVDSQKLSDIELEQMISAKLVIEFKKPKKTDTDEIKRAFGALLKPVSDLDNFEFTTRQNKKITKGKEVLRTKEIHIETTESGLLNEAHLSQEMAKFILELENEKL